MRLQKYGAIWNNWKKTIHGKFPLVNHEKKQTYILHFLHFELVIVIHELEISAFINTKKCTKVWHNVQSNIGSLASKN